MDDLIKFLKEIFPIIDFEKNNKLTESGELDSLNLVMLIESLEEKYSISVPMDEIMPENFNSINSIYSLICKLIKK